MNASDSHSSYQQTTSADRPRVRGDESPVLGGVSRRRFLQAAGGAGALLLVPYRARAAQLVSAQDSVVVQWNNAFLAGVRASTIGPPMVSRALAIAHTCVYDAWSAYDDRAVGTVLGGSLRRPAAERTVANVSQAISFAAYRAAVDLFPGSQASVFDPMMSSLGYDPTDISTDTSTPTGIGNVSAQAVISARHHDGANQLGDYPGGTPGVPYSDYTGYVPANQPMDLRGAFNPSTVLDPNAWQPLWYLDAQGNLVKQPFLGAQWENVTTFALNRNQIVAPVPPATFGSAAYQAQADELITISAGLTDQQKMIAEYWADGPHTVTPPGHWCVFAQFVARRDQHGADLAGIEADTKLFFALTNAVFDAGCAAWTLKRIYNSVRPITAIRLLFNGKTISAWGGPDQGTQQIDGGTWRPYQASTFPTPPFPEYISGHSAFSAAGADILRRFTASDVFGNSVTLAPGSSAFEPGTVPAAAITLTWPTFTSAANQAGISRRYGGIHFADGDLTGRLLGTIAGETAWTAATNYWVG
ncbi:MAG TPA: vanadium-dependent haloperoxidase [Streptosporangiaceae bacterium]|nr:vanadium-dependent haloperoxidase [Streptosporangiaceae bacterium]